MKSAPERIYLQWWGDEEPDDVSVPDHKDVTWCQDKINESDIEYVRADKIEQLEAALGEAAKYRMRWKCTDGALFVPPGEAKAFVEAIDKWLKEMSKEKNMEIDKWLDEVSELGYKWTSEDESKLLAIARAGVELAEAALEYRRGSICAACAGDHGADFPHPNDKARDAMNTALDNFNRAVKE